ncbi:hypothetical protein, partial [Pseudomonas sp. G5(2012)]|uniref:hypothetical protein n=1 Tax=Pseudomonas sp. G5(2012) TaxID=1268068 RepID=UPI001C459CF0
MTWRVTLQACTRIEPPFALVAPECSSPIERFSEIGLFFAQGFVNGPITTVGASLLAIDRSHA